MHQLFVISYMLCLYSYNKYLYSILYLYYMLYSSISFINAHTFSFPFSARPTDFFFILLYATITLIFFFSSCTPPKIFTQKNSLASSQAIKYYNLQNSDICSLLPCTLTYVLPSFVLYIISLWQDCILLSTTYAI